MTRKTYYINSPDYDLPYRGRGGAYTVVVEKDHFGGGLVVGMLATLFVVALLAFFNHAASQNSDQTQGYDSPAANEQVYGEQPATPSNNTVDRN